MKFCLSAETPLTLELIKKILQKNKSNTARLTRLMDYYCGKHDILNRKVSDATKPNNKIAHPYCQYITDTICGYFIGEPITYSSTDEDVHNELAAINVYNSTAAVDMDIARTMSIYGKAYELHYTDDEGMPCFIKLNPEEVIVVYDDTVKQEILYGIRMIPQYDIATDKTWYRVEVYDATVRRTYKADEQLSSLTLLEETSHYYGMVPIVEYLNNEQELGDFETVIPLVDAYDALESDALNDFNYFVDCYLTLSGVTADAEDIQQMKENRVIILDEDGEADWLIKSENDTVSENLKNRFKNDIHKFAKVPDLSDEAFSSNASGVAIKYKLFGTETLVANKERYFKQGIDRRLELLFNIVNLKGAASDWRAVEVQFTRNLPTNETEIADVVSKLYGIVSNETLLAQIPFITDVKAELEKVREQKEEMPFYDLGRELKTEGDE